MSSCRLLLPVVVFVFSRKRIDQLADNLNSLDLTSASEKAEIHIFVEQSVARLKGGDRRLPQILRLKQMLKRGLAVHHAGMLMRLEFNFCGQGLDHAGMLTLSMSMLCMLTLLRFHGAAAPFLARER